MKKIGFYHRMQKHFDLNIAKLDKNKLKRDLYKQFAQLEIGRE